LPGRLWFAIPGNIDTRTGGTLYDKRVITELRTAGWRVGHLAWPASFPFPAAEDLAVVKASLAACPDNASVMIDGLAFGVMPDLVVAEAGRLRLVALVHHPLALESGLPPDVAERFRASERQALSSVSHVVVTSAMTAKTLAADYNVARERITVAHPGTDKPKTPVIRPPDRQLHLLSVGTVTPRKAHGVLVDALSQIVELDWHCTIAGSLERDRETADALQRQIADLGLEQRVKLTGEIDDLTSLYERADLMVSSSRYEGFGMAIAEALAYGLPIVAARGGAVADVVPADAGVLVPADDPAALAAALRRVIDDRAYRAALAAGARAAGEKLAGWDQTAAAIASALDKV
jgi:glycosyltransferase involved in cell wall biosynthesis